MFQLLNSWMKAAKVEIVNRVATEGSKNTELDSRKAILISKRGNDGLSRLV